MRARATRPGRGRHLPAVAGATLLVALGFGVGLVAGAAFEDPALLFASLTGRGEVVALAPLEDLAEGAAIGETPPALAEPERRPAETAPERPTPAPRVAADVAAAPPAAPQAAPAPRPAPAPPVATSGRFAIQVGAFADEQTAERLAAALRALELPVYVAPGERDGRTRYRVRVGPLASDDAARRLAGRIQAEHRLPTWVLREEGP